MIIEQEGRALGAGATVNLPKVREFDRQFGVTGSVKMKPVSAPDDGAQAEQLQHHLAEFADLLQVTLAEIRARY